MWICGIQNKEGIKVVEIKRDPIVNVFNKMKEVADECEFVLELEDEQININAKVRKKNFFGNMRVVEEDYATLFLEDDDDETEGLNVVTNFEEEDEEYQRLFKFLEAAEKKLEIKISLETEE